MTRSTRTLVLGFALLALTRTAAADASATERETARTLLLSGREKRSAGDLHGALVDFEHANGIMHVPTTGLELGRTQAALGLLVEARATLLEAARHPAEDGEPRAFTRARKEAKELADALAG